MRVGSWGKCTDRVPLAQLLPYHSYETLLVPVWWGVGATGWSVRWTYPLRTAPRLPVEPEFLAHISPRERAHILLTGECRCPKR